MINQKDKILIPDNYAPPSDFKVQTLLKMVEKTMYGNSGESPHLMTLFSIALQMKSKKILELGVRKGNTSEPLLFGAVMNDGKLTSVDIDPLLWTPPTDFLSNYEFIQIDALKFLENCVQTNRRFDLIFIDDWHSYEHVKKELELIDKISDPLTIILLHDLMAFNNQPHYFFPLHSGDEWAAGGPFRAVYEFDSKKTKWGGEYSIIMNDWEWATIPASMGLTILRKRSKTINF